MNLTKVDKIILDHIRFNIKGIDENTLYFDLELFFNIKDFSRSITGTDISCHLIYLKMNRLIMAERVYFQNGESMVVYKATNDNSIR